MQIRNYVSTFMQRIISTQSASHHLRILPPALEPRLIKEGRLVRWDFKHLK